MTRPRKVFGRVTVELPDADGRRKWRFEQTPDGVLVRRLSSRNQIFVPFQQLVDLARGQGIFKI